MSVIAYLTGPLAQISFSDAEWVARQGKIFAVGRYDHPQPDQQFEFTDADADAAIAAFAPVFAETEHFLTDQKPSIFDGKIGRLERVWRQGPDLFGEMRVPKFVDEVWSEAGRKISLVFDPAKKTIIRCGLVLRPRIPDAVMMSASDLEAAATGEGEVALARSYAEFADRSRSGANGDPSKSKESNMLKELEQGNSGGSAPPAVPVEFAQQLAAMEAENKRLRELQEQSAQRLAGVEAERRVERAKTRITDLIHNQRKLPAAVFNDAVALLARQYADDESSPVKFAATSGGTERNRADTLLAVLDALPVSRMGEERIPVHLLRFSDDETAEERAKNPLTPEGAAASARADAERRNGRKGN